MKILRLKAENIKKLVAVEIEPSGAVVKITGANGAGKTSVLDSIYMALGGEGAIPDVPVHKGERRGKIELDMGEFVVRRTFTEKGTALVIENKDGVKFTSPQKMLDSLLGKLTFDPLEFMRMEPKKQFETLKALTGVDLSDLEAKREKLYAARTQANRDVEAARVKHGSLTVPAGAPEKEISSAELLAKIGDAMATKAKIDHATADHDGIIARMEEKRAVALSSRNAAIALNNKIAENEVADKIHADILKKKAPDLEEIDKQIEALQEKRSGIVEELNKRARSEAYRAELAKTIADQKLRVEDLKNEAKKAEAFIEDLKTKSAAIKSDLNIDVPDIDALNDQLNGLEEKNRAARARAEKERLKEELKKAEDEAETLNNGIAALDKEKADRMRKAKFPIEGLSFGDGTVIYDDIPLAQASDSEKLRVSMAMAMAMNPKLRVLRITDGSLLDSKSMKVVEKLCRDNDYQCWMEVVDESGKVGIVIEDGMVKKVNQTQEVE